MIPTVIKQVELKNPQQERKNKTYIKPLEKLSGFLILPKFNKF